MFEKLILYKFEFNINVHHLNECDLDLNYILNYSKIVINMN